MTKDPPKHAILNLPKWLWGGDPGRLLASMACRYRTRAAGSDGYAVQPEERYLNMSPNLVRCKTLAGPQMKPRLEELADLEERIQVSMPPDVRHALKRLLVKAEGSSQLIDLINYERVALTVTPIADLPERAAYLLKKIADTPLLEDPSVHPFSGAAVHVVEVDPALLNRLKIASIMLRLGQDPQLGSGDLSVLRDPHTDGVFLSSEGLYNGVYMLDAYLAPLLGALAPGVWGFTVLRSFGPIIFTLGRTIAGTGGEATEMLHLVTVAGPTQPVEAIELSSAAAAEAISWWVDRLNLLFGVLSDLAVFTDQSGRYRADKHLQAMLTVEQIFRRTTSMQVAHRDANARRTLMFSVIDSLERANGWDLSLMFTLSHAQKVLAALEDSLPGQAGEVLLPMARRAVKALQDVQGGFFISREQETAVVELRLTGGDTKSMSLEAAAASYLKLLRDATHGHGGKSKESMEQTAALLAHHDGRVQHDIGLLAYLYLLDVLANPDRLRRCLFRAGQ